jgi:hypothetical protein
MLWLYEQHFELETALINFIQIYLEESKIISYLKEKAEREEPYKDTMYNRYITDKSQNLDCRVYEYLFFTDVLNLIAKYKLFLKLNETSRKSFEEKYNPLNTLRNGIMHPAKSLINNDNNAGKLLKLIQTCESLLFTLNYTLSMDTDVKT